MSRADAERAAGMIDYSRVGAMRRAEQLGEGVICVPLVIDNAAEEAGLGELELVDLAYQHDKIKEMLGRNHSFERILEFFGGSRKHWHDLTEWLSEIEDRDNFNDLVLERVRVILKEARVKGNLTVLMVGEVKGLKGHVTYIKLGKRDENDVYVFDFFDVDGKRVFTHSLLPSGPGGIEYARRFFSTEKGKYEVWMGEFVIKPVPKFWQKVPAPEKV